MNFGNFGQSTPAPVVKNLILLNVLLYILTFLSDETSGFNITQYLGLYYFESPYFKPYQFVTHMFMHGGLMHIFFNMYSLWMFGKMLEMVWGPKRFFIYYIITGLGAAALHTAVNWYEISNISQAVSQYISQPNVDKFTLLISDNFREYYPQVYDKLISYWKSNPTDQEAINQSISYARELLSYKMNVPTVGASGAVYGILLGFGMLFPNLQIMMIFPFPMPIKAKYLVMIFGAMEIYMGFANQANDNVAHFAHLGGMLFGFILIKVWKKNLRNLG